MENDKIKVPSWGRIILILVAVGFVVGGLIGWLNMLFGGPSILTTGGIGAAVGVTAAILIAQRRAAIERQKSK